MKLRIIIPAAARWTLLQYVFLAIGIACLGRYGYAYLERIIYQAQESREFDRTTDRVAAASASADRIGPIGRLARSSGKSTPSTRRSPPAALIGRLSIPRLHLSAMVREGIDSDTLQVAVGHIPATALPGETGNVGLAGHRDTFFHGLKDVRRQDEIRFSTLRGEFHYEVESLSVVEPDNVAALASLSENELTLVTCYPFSYVGAAPKRFVVRARQVPSQMKGQGTVE